MTTVTDHNVDSSFAGRLLGLLVAWVAAWFLVIQPLMKANATANWPSTTGTVISSSHTTSISKIGRYHYHPEVHYCYDVPGRASAFTSKQVSATGLFFTSQQDVQRFLAEYQPGMSVRVYYNPADPADSVLTTGITRVIHWIALVVLVAATVAAIGWWKNRQEPSPTARPEDELALENGSEACPACGLKYGWDGGECAHCHYGNRQEPSSTARPEDVALENASEGCPRLGFKTKWLNYCGSRERAIQCFPKSQRGGVR